MNLHHENRHRNSSPGQMDQLLALHFTSGEQLEPSSGFTLSVMDALHAETSAPPPLLFPWRRVAPGLIALLGAMVGCGILVLRELHRITAAAGPQQNLSAAFAPMPTMHLTLLEQAVCWVTASVCLSIVALAGAMRLTRR